MTIDVMSPEELVKHLLGQLGETAERPRTQMAALVQALGSDRCMALLYETRAVETQGGMLLPDGRRRTAGGVYFVLARARLNKEQRKAIFDPWYAPTKKAERPRAPRAAPAPEVVAEVVRRRPPPAARPEPPEPKVEEAPPPPARKRVVSPPPARSPESPARGRARATEGAAKGRAPAARPSSTAGAGPKKK